MPLPTSAAPPTMSPAPTRPGTACPGFSRRISPSPSPSLLAGSDRIGRSRTLAWGERREDGKITVFLEIVERDLAIAHRRQFAAQQTRRSAVRLSLFAGIDHRDSGARPERRAQVPQEAIRLLDFVVHVDEESEVDRPGR